MVSSRKRALRDIEAEVDDTSESSKESPMLHRIRSSWHFANLFQWIYLFGKVVKIDESLDIDDLEAECLKPHSTVLLDIGLALLKWISSHRGLTPDLFDEYTRRQYMAKSPDRNPFGTDGTAAKFDEFDALLKIKILQQLTQWVMLHPERIREKMDEQKPSDQTEWRIEPVGWDSDDRTYYVLDDNRLYRMSPAPPVQAVWKPKKNSKKAKAAARAAKRRRLSRSTAQNGEDMDDNPAKDADEPTKPEDDGLGGAKWECIATNLGEVERFIDTLRKTRDDNEKVLKDAVEGHLLPILERQEESRKRKALQKEKELLALQKLAHAKRSSRLANKAEQQKLDQIAREEEQKHRLEDIAARKEEQKRLKMEKERDNRLMSREQRLKEREVRRLQHEEELAQLSEDSKNVSSSGRLSERRLQAEIEKNKQALQELDDEEEDWIFDCVCGVYGQVDDGTHSVACERCNVWQHSECLGISEEEADRDDFHFICKSCHHERLVNPTDPRSTIVKVNSNRPEAASATTYMGEAVPTDSSPKTTKNSSIVVEIPANSGINGSLSDSVQKSSPASPTHLEPIPKLPSQPTIPVKHIGPPSSPYTNGDGHNPFSSPHPTLSPPHQSPNKSRAYSGLFNPSSPTINQNASTEHKKAPQKVASPSTNSITQLTPSSTLPPHADVGVPSATTRPDSPLKQPFDNATNNLSKLSPPTTTSIVMPPVQTPSIHTNARRPSLSLSTPQLVKDDVLSRLDITPTLPPTQNGISPLKRSSPPAQRYPSNGVRSSPAPIRPPVTLAPSPSQQISRPPVKSADPPRPPSQHSGSFIADT